MTRNQLFPPDPRRRRQPSKAAKTRVREAFDADALTRICTLPNFGGYAPRTDLPPGRFERERFYHHQDNGSPILAVAHLDTVQDNGSCTVVDTAAGLLACSGALDDRLGAYVILDLLPKLGITCDWLLTTDEEMGDSTATWFETGKQYNWIIQFDRAGTDVVMYQYQTPELVEMVEESGARVGVGSYSDICELDHLGCAAFNWGVGYEDYHSARSHAWLDDTFRMVARFAKFHKANARTFLPFDPYALDGPDDDALDGPDDDEYIGEYITGDCGHEVDLSDTKSYILLDGVDRVCRNCGTAA